MFQSLSWNGIDLWVGVWFWWLMMPQRIGDYSTVASVGIPNTQYLSFYSYLFCASSRCQCRHSLSPVLGQSPLFTANWEQSKRRKWLSKSFNLDIFISPEIPVNGNNIFIHPLKVDGKALRNILTGPQWDNRIHLSIVVVCICLSRMIFSNRFDMLISVHFSRRLRLGAHSCKRIITIYTEYNGKIPMAAWRQSFFKLNSLLVFVSPGQLDFHLDRMTELNPISFVGIELCAPVFRFKRPGKRLQQN